MNDSDCFPVFQGPDYQAVASGGEGYANVAVVRGPVAPQQPTFWEQRKDKSCPECRGRRTCFMCTEYYESQNRCA
jgi:hypothetical protein